MSPVSFWLIALAAASLLPARGRAAPADSPLFQQFSLHEKVEAVRNIVSLLSIKAALLSARAGKDAAIQSREDAGEAQTRYRQEESELESTFLRGVDCQLGLEPADVCDVEGRVGYAGREGAAAETRPSNADPGSLSEAVSPVTEYTAVAAEPMRPVPPDRGGDPHGSPLVSLDLKASWTVSALHGGGEDLFTDTELLAHLGRKAGDVARDFLRAAVAGRLLEPSSKTPVGDFEEEKLAEVVRLAGKFLGFLQVDVTPKTVNVDAQASADAVRRLKTKEQESCTPNVHRDCKCKSHKDKKCGIKAKCKMRGETKDKACCSKDKCDSNTGKGKAGPKKKCGKPCPTASEDGFVLVPPAPITSTALPLYSSYPVLIQPQLISLPAPAPGIPIIYGFSNGGTAAAINTEGTPFYHDGVLLYPLAHGADGGSYQWNVNAVDQGVGPFTSAGLGAGVAISGDADSAQALRSSEPVPRFTAPTRSLILQGLPPLILGPIQALNAQVHQSPLLSPLQRSALGRYLFNAGDALHYEELKNFNMTKADLL